MLAPRRFRRDLGVTTFMATVGSRSRLVEVLQELWDPGQLALLTTKNRHPVQVEMAQGERWREYWDEFFLGKEVFYGHVLGWRYDPASRQVTNTDQPIGIVAMPGSPTLFCCYAVVDVAAARQAILDEGGQAGEILPRLIA